MTALRFEVAAGHATVKTPGKLTASADGGTEITSPIVLNGNVTINGNLSQGMGPAAAARQCMAR
jgi:hypothetical protein